jgi:hypothetical protein
MWSAFECATYAELSGNVEERARLFQVGYDAGRSFLTGIQDRTISEAETQKAPFGVLLVLGGPSVNFMVGRVFESATRCANDAVSREDPSKWVPDNELRANIASIKFRRSNCELIQ